MEVKHFLKRNTFKMSNVVHIMKNILVAVVSLLMFSNCLLSQGVDFNIGKFEKAKKEAVKSGKIIFVDAYTSWCAPCKWMDANVFNQEKFSKFFNGSFVNLKLDMEEGEGIAFAQEYEVMAYPTFFFLSPTGEVLHKALGGYPSDQLMAIALDALQPRTQLATYQSEHKNNKQNPEFLKNYARLLDQLRIGNKGEILRDYLFTQSDWTTEENTKIIYDNIGIDLESKLFTYLLNHTDQFYEHISQSKVDQKIINAIHGSLGPEGTPSEFEAELIRLFPQHSQRIMDKLYLEEMMASDIIADVEIFTNMAYFYALHWKPNDWEYLNNLAWIIYKEGQTTEQFRKGKDIALESVRVDSNYYNNDTVAALYYMMKDKGQAMNFAMRALELSMESGFDNSSTQTLIQMIKEL